MDWRTLKLNDLVLVVAWPLELDRRLLHESTAALYDWLIRSRTPLRVARFDAQSVPMGEIVRDVDGATIIETLGLNHSGLERA